jgi:hypothetical protein
MRPMEASRDVREVQPILDLLNQVFEIDKKVRKFHEASGIDRHLRKMRSIFEDGIRLGVGSAIAEVRLTYHDPTGEPYDETRTDCDASIAGSSLDNLRIVETIKPIIRLQSGSSNVILQRAVVIARAAESSPASDESAAET